MSSRLLKFSLFLNMVLLGIAGYWMASHDPSTKPLPASAVVSQSGSQPSSEPVPTSSPTPLHWSELESEDYTIYIANLRKAGCPEPVLRRIISADLEELYARKAFALVEQFHRDFWQIAAREKIKHYYDTTLAQQAKAVCDESDAMLKQLLGEAPNEPPRAPTSKGTDTQLTDFLSPLKQQQLRELVERYEARKQAIQKSEGTQQEKEIRLAQLESDMAEEQKTILTPEELAEYKLRQSEAAKEVQHLFGVDFSESEMRKLATVLDDYHHRPPSETEVETETLDDKLKAALGPARFADLNRSRSESYRELYELVTDFGQPASAAAEIFDLRLQSENQCEAIRSDRNRPAEQKQALLDDLEDKVDRNVRAKLGAAAYQSYTATTGRWIHALGSL